MDEAVASDEENVEQWKIRQGTDDIDTVMKQVIE